MNDANWNSSTSSSINIERLKEIANKFVGYKPPIIVVIDTEYQMLKHILKQLIPDGPDERPQADNIEHFNGIPVLAVPIEQYSQTLYDQAKTHNVVTWRAPNVID